MMFGGARSILFFLVVGKTQAQMSSPLVQNDPGIQELIRAMDEEMRESLDASYGKWEMDLDKRQYDRKGLAFMGVGMNGQGNGNAYDDSPSRRTYDNPWFSGIQGKGGFEEILKQAWNAQERLAANWFKLEGEVKSQVAQAIIRRVGPKAAQVQTLQGRIKNAIDSLKTTQSDREAKVETEVSDADTYYTDTMKEINDQVEANEDEATKLIEAWEPKYEEMIEKIDALIPVEDQEIEKLMDDSAEIMDTFGSTDTAETDTRDFLLSQKESMATFYTTSMAALQSILDTFIQHETSMTDNDYGTRAYADYAQTKLDDLETDITDSTHDFSDKLDSEQARNK